ncbi:FAD-binding protein [Paraburkholderia sp. MMS20-SJTN17]|uniref:FAD-binding protein n=1 Tax=Paraburkholderia translucens TaxID=2886945 RepID=A0ABS8KCQ7_9BURK|nr:FAD-binding protein [Paraburkholderia sp. MMS20-SJTN17]MCC8402490.1 FAD-binding protein [Paraburkholderia sp. MMS20-SJTN17]
MSKNRAATIKDGRRRRVLGAGLALAATSVLPNAQAATTSRYVEPDAPGWPEASRWAELNEALGGRLSPVTRPDFGDPAIQKLLTNPFYIGEQAGLTQNSGWLDAWQSSPAAYVVAAESAADVAAAINFARRHNVRLVVKGGGHSYLGTSSAPGSLLIWTRPMNAITVHEAFTPQGSSAAPVPAVSVAAGCIWLNVYQAVTSGSGRYVQGGGCTSVGVAGLVQGGGFGSFSKRYGLAAASLLEAEIVTADGKTRVVNSVREPDLFWALKGGGGGTFGVVTRLVLATHELPASFGAVNLDVTAHSDDAYRRLLARFIDLYATRLFNAHWGEQVIVRPDNLLRIRMVFQDLNEDQARAQWQPLIEFLSANRDDYAGAESFAVHALPARYFWDANFFRRYAPDIVDFDNRPGASTDHFWWIGDAHQVGSFWYAFNSAWLPASLLRQENQGRFVDAWFAASRHWELALQFSKGLAGAPAAVIDAARGTAMNPEVADAFAWAVSAANGPSAFSGLPASDHTKAAASRSGIVNAMTALRAIAPGAGTYLNESDYFQADWQQAFWGANYSRLLDIKRRYDPEGLFTVHHGVGSKV